MHLRRHIRPHHEQRAMRQVQHVHHAEDQGQAGGNEEQHEAVARTVEQLLKNKNGVHGKAAVREAEDKAMKRSQRWVIKKGGAGETGLRQGQAHFSLHWAAYASP